MKQLTAVWCLAGLGVITGVGLLKQDTAAANYNARPATTQPTAAEEVVPVEDSMHEFMEYVFQPTYKRLKVSMAAAPADNNGWNAVKSDALILAESCNLLLGRKPDNDGDDWVKHAIASKNAGAELYQAARAKNYEAASTSYRKMLDNCNACHRQLEDGKHILQP